jgi:hypothetical protein
MRRSVTSALHLIPVFTFLAPPAEEIGVIELPHTCGSPVPTLSRSCSVTREPPPGPERTRHGESASSPPQFGRCCELPLKLSAVESPLTEASLSLPAQPPEPPAEPQRPHRVESAFSPPLETSFRLNRP